MKFPELRKQNSVGNGAFWRYLYSLKSSDRFLLTIVLLAVLVSLLWSLIAFDTRMSVSVPAEDGLLTEGIIGTPRFVNPVLAVTRADQDLDALIYAGLMRLDGDGSVVPDVAESVTISDDGLVYNIILRSDVLFHDGVPLTADDVAFTIARIQNPLLASPLRASWENVTVEVIARNELNFILEEPYAPFVENLTVGILPEHIWKDASDEEFPFSQHNSEPIGAGPYEIRNVLRDSSGIPETYILQAHTEYHRSPAKIQTIVLNFYTNEALLIEAFKTNEITSVAGLSPEGIAQLELGEDGHTLITTPLPRTFAVFFNQNRSTALRDEAARKALDAAIDREALIDSVLGGYGEMLHSPIPPGFGITTELEEESEPPLDAARTLLREGGWELSEETRIWEKEIDEEVVPLALSIATANSSIFENTAEHLRERWQQLGANVTVRLFDQSDLTQAIIRPRDYEALLFGTAVGRALDFYSFWHSSQRNDPGLNVALYANITTDSILEKARTSSDTSERSETFLRFADEIKEETPAVFLYSPEFTYILPTRVTGTSFVGLSEPYERFAGVSDWYVETESVWPIFTHNN